MKIELFLIGRYQSNKSEDTNPTGLVNKENARKEISRKPAGVSFGLCPKLLRFVLLCDLDEFSDTFLRCRLTIWPILALVIAIEPM